MRHTCFRDCAAVAFLVTASVMSAQEPGRVRFETYALPNGLKVILSEDHAAQVVAVDIWYNVGSRNERSGRTGFAHLFEHMMFQGSANVKKSEHFQLVERAGGQLNGSTTEDRTNYFETLPSNRINLGLWLEADRMRSLAVTDSNFHNQREAVKEERRLRVDNQPYTRAFFEDQYALADSSSCFPYAHSVIGSMADLNAATTDDVKGFFRQYYAPNNATLVVVGDFDPADTKRLIEAYFGGIARVNDIPPVSACEPRYHGGAIRRPLVDAKATLPATMQAYRIPAYDHPDTPALVLLSTILGQGESSRLTRKLERETKASAGTQVFLHIIGPRRGPNVFAAFAVANQGVGVDSLDRLLAMEFARLASDGVSAEELQKAKNTYKANAIDARQHAFSIAEALQTANLFNGDADAINTDPGRYDAVTIDDIKRVARAYLVPDNSLTVLFTPPGTTP